MRKKNVNTVNKTGAIDVEPINTNDISKEENTMNENTNNMEHIEDRKFTDKIMNAWDVTTAFARKHWRKLLFGAMGVATAVALPMILDKKNETPELPAEEDIPFLPEDEEKTEEPSQETAETEEAE